MKYVKAIGSIFRLISYWIVAYLAQKAGYDLLGQFGITALAAICMLISHVAEGE